LKLVAVAIVAHAIVGMSQNLTPDLKRKAIALMALVVTLLWQTTYTQIGIILVSAFMGYLIYQKHRDHHQSNTHFPI
ncbi:hypothetical protein SB816_35255, partial [Achromobacter sp. SIMBA_011]